MGSVRWFKISDLYVCPSEGVYSLSVRHRNIKHYKIFRMANSWYYISPRLTFQCLEDMVNHYSGQCWLSLSVCTVCGCISHECIFLNTDLYCWSYYKGRLCLSVCVCVFMHMFLFTESSVYRITGILCLRLHRFCRYVKWCVYMCLTKLKERKICCLCFCEWVCLCMCVTEWERVCVYVCTICVCVCVCLLSVWSVCFQS